MYLYSHQCEGRKRWCKLGETALPLFTSTQCGGMNDQAQSEVDMSHRVNGMYGRAGVKKNKIYIYIFQAPSKTLRCQNCLTFKVWKPQIVL